MNTLPTLNRAGRSLAQHAVAGLGFARHPMVSRAGNRFTLIDGSGNERSGSGLDQQGRIYIDVVIFDSSHYPNRMFFEGNYEPGTSSPPDCFSDNGTGPSTQSRNPQSPTCAACPQAVWGSRVTQQGKEVPACQTAKKLAVLVVGDDSGLAYEFRIPPGSFSAQPTTDPQEGGWNWYVKTLKGHGAELFEVVTRVSFVPNTMGQLVFKPVRQLDADLILRVNDVWDRGASDTLVGHDDKAIDPASFGQRGGAPAQPRAPGPGLPPPAPAAAPAPLTFVGQAQAPQQPQEAPKKPGRPKKPPAQETEPVAPAAAPQAPPEIPAFLRRAAPEPPPPAAQPQSFGMAPAGAPSPDLQAKLAAAFALPTG